MHDFLYKDGENLFITQLYIFKCLKINCDRCDNAFVVIFFKTLAQSSGHSRDILVVSCEKWRWAALLVGGPRDFFLLLGGLYFGQHQAFFPGVVHQIRSVGFCRGSRVEGKMSRVEGRMSRGEGNMLRIEGSKMSSIYLLSFNIIVLYPLALNFPPFTH